MGLAGEAVLAVPTEDGETRDDVIARLELADLEADLLDNPRGLVAEDGGRGERVVAIDEVEVAVTDPRGDDSDKDLAADGLVDVDFLDCQRLVRTMEYGCFHTGLLCGSSGIRASRRHADCAAPANVSRPVAAAGSDRARLR